MLFKFVIILLVTVHGLVDAKSVTSGGQPKKTLKEVTNDDDRVKENAQDCSAIYANEKAKGHQAKSGVYTISPKEGESFEVYCDMTTDGGGWTVIQRRGDYKPYQSFYQNWAMYKEGFGDVKRDYWLGNDKISILTNQDAYNLRFDLEDFGGQKRFAEYSGFRVAGEPDKYRMTFDSFLNGDAGDSFTFQKDMPFSTKDQNNHPSKTYGGNCADHFKGGWWYSDCHESNLNGLYLRGDHPKQFAQGINWKSFRGYYHSMKKASMKIRPTSFNNER
jgi:ficolin